MDYNVILPDFEGPLDLLLHLIKKSDIDIFDIRIDDITKQYLDYIHKMEELNLNIASEYLVMASDLLELKSRTLLPRDEDNPTEEDPREELINRLIQYQRYKDISLELKSLESDRKHFYCKAPSLLNEFHEKGPIICDDLSLDDLVNAFLKFQEKKSFAKPLNTVVTRKEYSVHKRSSEILKRLKEKKKIKFDDLFDIYSRDYVIVTFLAVLELAKTGGVFLKQDSNLDSIILYSKGDN